MRVVFFGTPEFAVPALQALSASRHGLLAVVTRPDRPRGRGLKSVPSPVKGEAARLGLATLEPERLAGALLERLRELAPEALAVAAYGKILPREVLALTPARAINLHASLLPRHRGAAPIQAAILAGDAETGVTTMQMDEGLDTGAMLLRLVTPIAPLESAGELGRRLAALGAPLLVETLDRIETGAVEPQPQDGAGATYAPRIQASDAVLDWREPAPMIARRVRAYDPWPGAVTTLPGGRRLKVRRVQERPGRAAADPGTVVAAGAGGLEVACGEGSLVLLEVQPEGKRPMRAADLVNGRLVRAGDRLGV